MSINFIGNADPKQKDFNIILADINKNQKEMLEKVKTKFTLFDSEKRKYNLQMLSILWSTYLSTMGNISQKEFTKEDIDLIKSLTSEEDKEKINDLFTLINSFENKNINNNIQNQELYEANLLNMEKKKSDLKIALNKESKNEEEKIINTCIICTEEFDENDIMNPEIFECQKHIHGKCFIEYIEEELNNNRFPIRCPLCAGKDRHEINYKTIIDCLLLNDKDNLAAKLENISLNHLAENNSDEITFCPTAGCNYMCSYDKNEFHLNCPMCKKSYCLQCKTEWHNDMTCQEYQRSKNKDANDVKFEEYIKGSKLKQCPKCKRWVEKVSGCDHIKCSCGTPFCYRCGNIKESDFDHGCKYCGNNIFGNNGLFGNVVYPIRNYMNPNPHGFNNPGLFGYNNPGIFGNNYQNPGGLFGNINQNQGGLFGNINPNQGGLFGNINQNQGGLFGNNNQNQRGLFGNNNQNQGGLFGNNNQNQGGLFGNAINNNKGLFGNNNPNQGTLFGNNNNNIFTVNNQNQNTGLFGNIINNPNNNLYPNNNPPPVGLFGNVVNNNNRSLFGTNYTNNNNNNNNNNTSIFGNFNNNKK